MVRAMTCQSEAGVLGDLPRNQGFLKLDPKSRAIASACFETYHTLEKALHRFTPSFRKPRPFFAMERHNRLSASNNSSGSLEP
jgi:hypothetical protein